ncbi:MAG: hypothetical protein DRQ78_00875 [Epsilonproteobacteria bacterium]|nr:MAG: hypothetical protein DRQ78_00875 [Campylobacterota bacterium]
MADNKSNKDIEFDRYGDMSFIGNDISFVFTDIDYLYQNVIDRLITNFNDYYLYKNAGANLSFFIGDITNSTTENKIIKNITHALTDDGLVPIALLDIVTLIDKNSILIKIQIGGTGQGISEIFTINSIFNTSSGLLYVTN